MTYTVCLDIYFDDDNIMDEKKLRECLELIFNSAATDISNIKLLDVND